MTGINERIIALRTDTSPSVEVLTPLLSKAARVLKQTSDSESIRLFSAIADYAHRLGIPSARLPGKLTHGNGYLDQFSRWGTLSSTSDRAQCPSRAEMVAVCTWLEEFCTPKQACA